MDEIGVMLCMLGSLKVLVGKDNLRTYRSAGVKRTMVTAVECISADSRSLFLLIIWPAATHRSTWTTYPTPGWHFACSQSGYTDSKISLDWVKHVFDPQTKPRANQKPQILICDGFGRTSRSKSWSIVLKTISSFVVFRRTRPISSNPVTSESLAH
jgi:hypothetical protein